MRHLLALVLAVVRGERAALFRGFALSITVLAMGVALLGLSGWFITAAAAAGLAGAGILFNVFVPSAMVRLLALGRTAARYGERLLTHDATLRALSRIRVQLLQGLLTRPYRELERLRANAFLNRVTADIDALDGALLRLVLPSLAGGVVIVCATVALWVLVHPAIALVVGVGYLVLPTVVFVIGQRLAQCPARRAEAAMQAGRSRLIDLVAARDDLTVYGQLHPEADRTRAAYARHDAARVQLDHVERLTGAALDLICATLTAIALCLGALLSQGGEISPARAAIGVFVALALAETVAPVRRALSEVGRMVQAARRVLPSLTPAAVTGGAGPLPDAPLLEFHDTVYRRAESEQGLFHPLNLTVGPGRVVALTGPSGCGKSTALLMASGALSPTGGAVLWAGRPVRDWAPDSLCQNVALVPQRHALIAGSVAENLRLADPDASDQALWRALEHVCLAQTICARGGLGMELGFRGAGLSGGESRRLVLARALLRRPRLLLLDEPTEGLDHDTSVSVMANICKALPDAAILIAAHRPAEIAAAGQNVALS